jgi:SAM-dependent methyltransferase
MKALLLTLAFVALPCAAQNQPFEPYEGQPGKDVVWVPTPRALLDKMLDLAGVTPRDFVVDLGSGDGRLVIAAAKRGARSLGIEYEADMVALSRRNATAEGVSDRAQFVQGDMFEADFSQATVLTLFLLPGNLEKLAPKFLQLAAGTRIVTNAYRIRGWEETEISYADGYCVTWCTAYLYLVPAKVAGAWRLPTGEVRFTQDFQTLSGTLIFPGGRHVRADGQVKGDHVRFSAGLDVYTGRVRGKEMSGEASGAYSGYWKAEHLR